MSDFEGLESSTPQPPVNVDDLRRVWRMVQMAKRVAMDRTVDLGAQGGVGIAAQAIADQCEPGVNVSAVFFRAGLLQYLFRAGLLDQWREGDAPSDSVFQVGATFPMEQGVQGFDATAFINRLHAL